MGVRGNVRRSTDGHIIHANVDTDVIISEEPEYGSTAKPEEIYAVIEHFSLGAIFGATACLSRTKCEPTGSASPRSKYQTVVSAAAVVLSLCGVAITNMIANLCRSSATGVVWGGPQHPARMGDGRPRPDLLKL